MSNYKYTAISLYLNNLENQESKLRELGLYVAPLEELINKIFGENDVWYLENSHRNDLSNKDHLRMRDSELFYNSSNINSIFAPEGTPIDKLDVQLKTIDNTGYLYIPLISKHQSQRLMQPLIEQLYELFREDIVQMAVTHIDENESFENIKPKVLMKN